MDNILLITDLFQAYYKARKNKRNTINQLKFELNFEHEIFKLCEEIENRTYKPSREIAFIVNKPVKREIFAADFRDRVVHHLLFRYISPIIEKYLIYDCYSCRKGKGTSAGIQRATKFLRSCSVNYKKDCYVMQMDISGYFMSINKELLYSKVNALLQVEYRKCAALNKAVAFDTSMVDFLLQKTIFRNPADNCIIKGLRSGWKGLPANKSLFFTLDGCGLPIGNLTSQLFGNIFLNDFDHWMKKNMGFNYYGRYVDDFFVVCRDKTRLLRALPEIASYLKENEKLTLHPDKIKTSYYKAGFLFLGAVIKPYRIYIGNRTKGNFYKKIQESNALIVKRGGILNKEEISQFLFSMNSYLGIMRHYDTYRLRKKILNDIVSVKFRDYAHVSSDYTKLTGKRSPVRWLNGNGKDAGLGVGGG